MTELTRTAKLVTHASAQDLVNAALSHARDQGWTIAVAVLDPWGHLVAAARMDGVAPPILDYAIDKAFTATLGRSTSAFFDRMNSSDELRLGLANRPRLCAWDGGLPIYAGQDIVGAIGVSGAKGHEDVVCAETALAAIGLSHCPT